MVRHTVQEYLERARAFLNWSEERLNNLRTIRRDHLFRYTESGDPTGRYILVAVDWFDLELLAFPFVSVLDDPEQRPDFFDERVQHEILKGMVARSVLFFEFSKEFPVYLPYPYKEEQADFNEVVRLMHSNLPRLDGLIKEIDAALQDREDSDSVDLSLLLSVCPKLLFYIAGKYQEGQRILRTLESKKKVTDNLDDWKPAFKGIRTLDESTIREYVSNEERIEFWKQQFRRRGKVFKPAYLNDIEAVLFVKFLNEQLNDHGVVVVYLSSADRVESALRLNPDEASCRYRFSEEQEEEGSFFRSLDEFRLYSRYMSKLTHSNGEKVVLDLNKIDEDIATLEGFTSEKNRGMLESSESDDRLMEQLVDLVDRIEGIRDELFKAHTIDACNEILRPYWFLGINPLTMTDRATFSESVNAIRSALRGYTDENLDEDRVRELDELIVETKINMACEYIVWLTASGVGRLRKTPDDHLRDLYFDSVLFPFRVRFKTPALCNDVEVLQKHFRDLKGSPSHKFIMEFAEDLSRLAERSESARHKKHYWSRRTELLNLSTPAALERKLVWLVLLFALRDYRLVYESARRLLALRVRYFRDEFRIIYMQARLREFWHAGHTEGGHILKIEAIGEILSLFDEWREAKEADDSRLWYLAAFSAGALARVSEVTGQRWHPNYDGAWTIRVANVALDRWSEEANLRELEGRGLTKAEKHLRSSIVATIAYCNAIEAKTTVDIVSAVNMYEQDMKLPDAEMTSVCLHNRGYSYMKALELGAPSDDFTKYCKRARDDFLESDAKRNRKLDIRGILKKPIDDLREIKRRKEHNSAPLRRLQLDAIRLRLEAHRKGITIDWQNTS